MPYRTVHTIGWSVAILLATFAIADRSANAQSAIANLRVGAVGTAIVTDTQTTGLFGGSLGFGFSSGIARDDTGSLFRERGALVWMWGIDAELDVSFFATSAVISVQGFVDFAFFLSPMSDGWFAMSAGLRTGLSIAAEAWTAAAYVPVLAMLNFHLFYHSLRVVLELPFGPAFPTDSAANTAFWLAARLGIAFHL